MRQVYHQRLTELAEEIASRCRLLFFDFESGFDFGFDLGSDVALASRFHAFWVPHSSLVLGRVVF
jgi:hypothetical protein